jgi:hypothetical protein
METLSAFVDMLNAMRFGNLDEVVVQAFKRLDRRVLYTDGIEPTDLYVLFLYLSFRNSVSFVL